MRRFIAWLLVAALMMACSMTARPTPNAQPAPTQLPVITQTPEIINLRIGITDGQQPVKSTIRLYWPDTGGEHATGLAFHAALLNDTLTEIRGDWDSLEFGF